MVTLEWDKKTSKKGENIKLFGMMEWTFHTMEFSLVSHLHFQCTDSFCNKPNTFS